MSNTLERLIPSRHAYRLCILSALGTIVGYVVLLAAEVQRHYDGSVTTDVYDWRTYLHQQWILVISYSLWTLTFLAYIKQLNGRQGIPPQAINAMHMRLAAVFAIFLFLFSKMIAMLFAHRSSQPEDKNSLTAQTVNTFFHSPNSAVLLVASVFFVLSTLHPKFDRTKVYGLFGSSCLLVATILSMWRSAKPHVSISIGMVFLIISATLNRTTGVGSSKK